MTFKIIQKIDELGRILLPIHLREYYEIAAGDTVVLLSAREGIQIAKTEYFFMDQTPKDAIVSIDELGRITIPISLRNQFKIKVSDALTFVMNETCMLIYKEKKQ